MTSDDLLNKIARPFVERKQFFCGGMVVIPEKVEQVRFNKTEQSSKELAPMIEARRRMNGVLSFTPSENDVIWEGEDITRSILETAEQHRGQKDEPAKAMTKSDRIFVVHGHDEAAVDQTEILIRRFGLTPIILRDAPSAGRTVIEKFEAHTEVGAAIVLLTPDDVGGVDERHLLPRARQNVIWEWGHLVSKLGRPNVICLYKGNVEMPSDLDGLVTIHIAGDIRDSAEEIRRELRVAGFTIA